MASTYRHLRARALKALFRAHASLYERTDGRLGSWMGLPVLLLTVTGRKSGERWSTPLVYFRDGERLVVVGSDGAARRDPQWCRNLAVHPRASVRVGRRSFEAVAHVATGPERERLWEIGQGVNPMWSNYQEHTDREIPVVVLTPA